MKNKLLAQFHFSRVRPNDKQVEFKNIAQEPLLTHRNSILEYTPMGRTQNPVQSCGNNEFKSLRSHYYVSLSSQRKRDCNSTVDYEVAYKNAALFERQGNEALDDMTSDGIRREHGASNKSFTPHSSKENCVSLNFHTFPLGEQQDYDTTSKGSISQSMARNADMSKDEGFGAAIEDGEVCKVKDAQVEDVVETEVGNRCFEKAIVNKFVGGSCIEDNDHVLYNIDCWQLYDQKYELVKDLSHLESLYQHNKENCEKEIKVAIGLEVGFEGLVEMNGEVESWEGSHGILFLLKQLQRK
ncbi:hypothetical protein TIFTF001_004895 [Ficus carica]|uniref:Uncharacterized protein n=1 Tax=Ficus carica TaxID=3494 RepID=A0AA88CXX7_FICCA|nr:hypothetical protein TIFTF001_004895 [Ficus carica]